MNRAVNLVIKGKVQGVFYRATAKKQADGLTLNGWVRNLANGDVEAEVYGAKDALEQFIQWCKSGPSGAVVKEVIVTEIEQDVTIEGFQIRK